MAITTNIKMALTNILTAKLRSVLTLLGILVGTGSVVALLFSGQLATEHALAQFKTLGTNLLALSVQDTGPTQQTNQVNSLNLTNIYQLRQSISAITNVAPYTVNYENVYFNDKKIASFVAGVDSGMHQIAKINLQAGRHISDLDQFENYAVLGATVAKATHLPAQSLLGKQIRIGNIIFTIVGVAKPWPESFFVLEDINKAVAVPVQSSYLLSKYTQIQNILFQLAPSANINDVENAIRERINQVVTNKQLIFRSAGQLIAQMAAQQQTFTLLLGAIGGISLLVGGIGVMNIMLVSVVERRREIGVRMAIGAKRTNIRMMFLTEAVVLTIFGGLLGIVIGILAAYIIADISGWGFQLFIFPPMIGFLVSMAVGVFFGFYPAYKASKLDPIDCLRSE